MIIHFPGLVVLNSRTRQGLGRILKTRADFFLNFATSQVYKEALCKAWWLVGKDVWKEYTDGKGNYLEDKGETISSKTPM
jgi:hypothetical protein